MPSANSSSDEDKMTANLSAAMRGLGADELTSAKYASFGTDIYNDLVKSGLDLREIAKANKEMNQGVKLMNGAKVLGLTSTAFRSYAVAGGGSVLNVIVDRYGAIAKNQGIELNECALSFSKLTLDIFTAGGGAVSSITGVGAVFAIIGIIATYQDSQAFAKACFN